MHLLLPPSEAKRPGGRGRSLRARGFGDGPLANARRDTLDALATLLRGPADEAAQALVLPPGPASAALAADATVLDSPTMPALRRYTGVVYDGLALDELEAAEQRLAMRSILVFSGLFGALRGDESVPDYRVAAKARLPGLGTVGTWWRPRLTAALPPLLDRGLVVDLRSSDYRAMWRPGRDIAARTVTVRVLSPTPRGTRGVVSFASKLAKGRLAAALIRAAAAGREARSASDVVAVWRECPGSDAASTPDAAPDAVDVELHTQ